MIIGHIYITGQIGSSELSKGVQLQDVVMQVAANKDADILHIHINSPGGSVNTGRLISEYISKLPNAVTIAETLCGSIATEIHLAVPLQNRKIVAGTEYFIHNPLLVDVTGNADELTEAAEYVTKFQKEMVAMYVKQTGADKSAIEGLMKAETSLTDEQCKSLGFVNEIIARVELKAVAFYDIEKKPNEKIKNLDMSKITDQIKEGFASLKAELGIEKKTEIKSMMVETDKGELVYLSEGSLPEVGEAVTIDGEPTGAGEYVMEDGTIIVVDEESNVSEIIPIEVEATVEDLQAKIVQMEKAHAEALEAKDSEFNEKLTEELTALKSLIKSDYVPKNEKKVFNKKAPKIELSIKEAAKLRKEELLAKK